MPRAVWVQPRGWLRDMGPTVRTATRILLVTFVCALFWAVPSQAAYSCSSSNFHTIAVGASPLTTSAINTTGADIIFVSVSAQVGSLALAITDSKTNLSWTELTEKATADARIVIYYHKNPTVGSGHTFTATIAGAATNPVITVLACSGSNTSSPADQETGATNTSTSIQPGSITPTTDNQVVVTAVTSGGGGSPTFAIDGCYSTQITDSTGNAGGNYAHAMAYCIQTTAGATNPTWSTWSSSAGAAVISSFKAAAAGGASPRGTLIGVAP